MKKGKYIDYNILLACLSKRPQATASQQMSLIEKRDIVEEFYEAFSITGRPVIATIGNGEEVCCK